MVKAQSGRKDGKAEGKAKPSTMIGGWKTRKEIMENLFQDYSDGTPSHVKSLISR